MEDSSVFFSNKGDCSSNIQLVEDIELLQDDQKIPDEFFQILSFKNAVSNLNINENTYTINHV